MNDGPVYLQRPTIAAYAQLPSSNLRLRDALRTCLKEPTLAAYFIRANPSAPVKRSEEMWSWFKQMWAESAATPTDARPWRVRRAILEQLPRLALRSRKWASSVATFLRDYYVIESVDVDTVEEVVQILASLTVAMPLEGLSLLEKLFGRISSEFPQHENALCAIVLAIARHPNAAPVLLQTVIARIAAFGSDHVNRVRGVVVAETWEREKKTLSEILSTTCTSWSVSNGSAIAAIS